jgi:hypothetical protein
LEKLSDGGLVRPYGGFMKIHFARTSTSSLLLVLASIVSMTACTGQEGDLGAATVQGQDIVSGPPAKIPPGEGDSSGGPVGGGDPPSSPTIGESCSSSDSTRYCVGLKYVVYADSQGTPVVSKEEAINNVKAVNSLWAQCNIAFQIDEFLPEDPVSYALRFNTASNSELDLIRRNFLDSDTLLLVTTGKWDRTGSLGSTGANAWAAMPGDGLYGVIMESPVGTYSNIIAHELGHYLNLGHYSSTTNLMNALIYSTSTQLTSSQCSAARSAVSYWWKAMLR